MGVSRILRLLLASLLFIALAGCKPIASFVIDQESPQVGKEVSFDASASSVGPVPKGNIVTAYRWEFGDGTTGTGRTVRHTYSAEGSYTVTLTVVDSVGKSSVARQTIDVAGKTLIAGPVNPIPSTLWTPEANSTPANGSYVYLQSDSGDYIGQGETHTYTRIDSQLTVTTEAGLVSVSVQGDQVWSGAFKGKSTLTELQSGYYPNLTRHPFHNPAIGGLNWSGDGRGCNQLTGWFAIDNVVYAGGVIQSIELRFEQRCEASSARLRGKIYWTSADTSEPSGPVNPPPGDLWQPAAGATPANGNFVYLESDPGDYIGVGKTHTYTPINARLTVSAIADLISVRVQGDQDWTGEFKGMSTIPSIQPGYYPGLTRYPFHNPTKGGLSWSGDGRGCNTLTGWFAIDRLVYDNGALQSLELRFEQRCEGNVPALRGKIRWSTEDATEPSGPVNPPPTGLWQPAAGATPANGNFVYLESDPGDFIGQGRKYTYTPDSSNIMASTIANGVRFNVNADRFWMGTFVPMENLPSLQPGYYGDLRRQTLSNPTKGGLDWAGDGRGCNTLTGWFVVDEVSYLNGEIRSIVLRFNQNCEGAGPALRGQIRWTHP
jgi:hypothetical protein